MRRLSIWSGGVKGAAILVLSGCLLLSTGWAAEIQGRRDFTLRDVNGKEVTLSHYLGKPIALVFWATFCPTCREELPDLVNLYNKYKNSGIVFLTIALDRHKPVSKIKEFLKRNNISYPVLIADSTVARRWGVRAIPAAFLIDREGNIAHRFTGLHVSVDLYRHLKKMVRR